MAAIKYLNNIDLGKNQIINGVIHNATSAPSSPVVGQLWYDSSIAVNKLKYWDGTEWVIADASTALASLDGDSLVTLINEGSSILSPEVGGIGLDASSASNGQILIGNGSGFSLSTISVSSPLSISNGSGTISITHLNTDGNKHVPANGTANGGKVLTAGSLSGSYTWETPSVAWANISNKPTSSVASIDSAVSKAHDQNTDTGTDSDSFQIDSSNLGPTLVSESGSLSIKNSAETSLINVNANSFTSLDSFIIKDGSYTNSIVTTPLSGNRTLELANGDTTLVAGTMVPDSRTITISTNNGLTGGGSAVNLSENRSWTLGLTGQAKAFHDLATNGIVTRTGTNTIVARTITGTSNKIDVTNGNGVSGNPTITISSTYAGQTSIKTLGTITTGTWQGTTIAPAYGGTGVDASSATVGQILIGKTGGGFSLNTITGTTNQINVSNGSGTITLSTPQNIHTNATPYFARLGLGTGPDSTANLKLKAGTIVSGVANSSTASGFTFSTPSYSTAGAKLLSIKNGTAEKLSVDLNGIVTLNNIKTGLAPSQDEIVKFNSDGSLAKSGYDITDIATGGRYAVFDRDSYTTTSSTTSIPFDLAVFEQETDALIVYENLVYYLEPGVDYTIDPTNDGITLLSGAKPAGTKYDFIAIKNVPEDGHTYSGIFITDGTITNAKLATDVKIGSLAALNSGIAGTDRESIVNAINYVYENSAQLQNSLTLSFDGGSTPGTDKYEFNGGSSVSINFIGETNNIVISKTSGQIQFKVGTTLADAISKRHSQNTDTGTTNTDFYIDSDNSGIRLKHHESELQVRNSNDTDYADIRVRDLYVEGTTTTINSNEVNIGDAIIKLNADITNDSENSSGGIEVKRLLSNDTTESNAGLIFDSSSNKWTAKFGPVTDVITRTIATKYSATIGNGSATSIRVNHKLNTMDLSVTVRENASPYAVVYTDIQFYDSNNVDIVFASAPSLEQYRVTIVG